MFIRQEKIEVASFISTMWDVSGTDEYIEKEKMPKGYDTWIILLGHSMNNTVTVIVRWSAI